MEFDLNNVLAAYRRFELPERSELIRKIGPEIMREREGRLLAAEIGEECYRQGLNPISAIAFTLAQGIVVGILLERDRAERGKRLT
jgi:hypothetical protein